MQAYTAFRTVPRGTTAPSAGVETVIAGGRRSIRKGPTGPASMQLPATSHTDLAPVAAAAVSVPASTDVARVKLASAGSATPEAASVALQATVTLSACQPASAAAQAIAGGSPSASTWWAKMSHPVPSAGTRFEAFDAKATSAPSGLRVGSWEIPFGSS